MILPCLANAASRGESGGNHARTFASSDTGLMPTSITTAPGFTKSGVTKAGLPMAATRMSAVRATAGRSRVLEWQMVTVA